MILGIVGSNGSKFTPATKVHAETIIRRLVMELGVMDTVCSGACHEGGIDVWAAAIARELGFDPIEYPATVHRWSGKGGYESRNKRIAQTSDRVVCITVADLPKEYDGMRFASCYHHDDEPEVKSHVKSGGCWTTKYARSLGKPTELIIV